MLETIRRGLLAGLFCILFGGFVVWQAYGFRIGTPARMGPGFLPVALGGMLVLIGVALVIQSLRESEYLDEINLRPLLFITLAIVGFGLTITRFGFLPAATIAVVLSGLAQPRMNKLHLALLTVVLVVAVYAIFAYVLRMPIDLVRWRP